MPEDKRKHKPQAKRTLEEVLRSLKDLVRHDLRRGSSRAGAPAPRPAAPDEPDSFNDALTRLDGMIDEKIVGPAARAPQAAPETPPADDALEIAWDDVDGSPDPAAAGIEYRADEPGEPTRDIDAGGHGHSRAGEAGAGNPTSNDAASAGLEGSEPQSPAIMDPVVLEGAPVPDRPASGGSQEAFGFAEPDTNEPGNVPASPADASTAPDDERGAEAFDHGDRGLSILEPETFEEATPAASGGERDEPGRAASVPAAPHQDTPAPDGMELATTPNDSREPPPPDQPGAGTDPASPASGDDAMSRKSQAAATPPAPRPSGAQDRPAVEPPTLEEEIPVLHQEAAPADPRAAPKLPEPVQAREIAIRAIARLNIERRKEGEAPLDVKTIERLQQYLAEALANTAGGRSK